MYHVTLYVFILNTVYRILHTEYYILYTIIMYLALDIRDAFPPAKNFETIADVLNIVMPLFMAGAGLVFFITLLIGGLTIITAGGNSERFQTGRKKITFSILGLLMVISSYFIVKLMEIIFGIDLPL